MGRKKLEPRAELVQDVPLNNEVLVAVQNSAAIAWEMRAARDLANQVLGQVQLAGAYEDFSRTVRISKLAYVKENKLYREIKGMKSRTGAELMKGTWEEFCSLLGRSVDQVDRDIANLRAFGEEALESMSRMGIGYRELGQYRRLPEDQKTALLEAAKAGDKESFVELAEELINKHAKEKEELQKRVEEAELNYEVRGKLITDKSQQIDELQLTVQKLQRHVHSEPAPERSKQLQAEVALIGIDLDLAGLQGKLRKAFAELQDDIEATGFDHREFMAGVIGKLERTLGSIRSEFYLRKMDNSEEEFLWIDQLARESHD